MHFLHENHVFLAVLKYIYNIHIYIYTYNIYTYVYIYIHAYIHSIGIIST